MILSRGTEAIYISSVSKGKVYSGKNNVKTTFKDYKHNKIVNFWHATFIGDAAQKIAYQRPNSKIKITNFCIKQSPYKTKDGETSMWLDLLVFDFEPNNPTDVLSDVEVTKEDEDELPF